MTQTSPPADLIAFLKDEAARDCVAAASASETRVEIIETHGAQVFIGPQITFKIKRPVKFSFMDFSTLEKRHEAIAREYEINSPHAPDIYLGIAPVIRRPSGGLAFDGDAEAGGPGEIVEWALRMRSFPQEDVLANRLKAGPLSDKMAKEIATMVARYHADAQRIDDADSIAQMRAIIDDLSGVLGSATGLIEPETFDIWRRQVDEALAQCKDVLRERARAGYIRRCHGDLHSGNIVIWNDHPTAFDAIEFDERIATIDTLYDLAFLLMDLDERGHRTEANLVLAQYLWHTRDAADLDGLRALAMFMSLRAAIRAMVTLHRARNAQDSEQTSPHKKRDEADIQSYFAYAASVLKPAPAQLVAVGGLSGTGKSTLAKALAPSIGRAPGAVHLRSDLERKAMFGVGETERLEARHYTSDVSARVYARLFDRTRHVLSAGQSAVVDAVFSTPQERQAIENIANEMGIVFTGLWLSAPLEVLQDRVTQRTGDASDATADVVTRQFESEPGPLTWTLIDASSTPAHALAQSKRHLP